MITDFNARCMLRIFIAPLHFNLHLYPPLAIVLAIADPDMTQLLPIVSIFKHREPRPCHKVHALQSHPSPDVIEPNTLDRAAGNQRLNIVSFHFKHVPAVERNSYRINPCSQFALIIDDPN